MSGAIEIIGTESLGVRGLCCFVKTGKRRILIDPGVALGYIRHGLLPHPLQVATGERVRQRIVEALTEATDVVFSHFHGDHVPLRKANPYQLAMRQLPANFQNICCWSKSVDDKVFLHASDIQLLDPAAVDFIIAWQADIVLAAGPPFYLERLTEELRTVAWENGLRLAQNVDILILDHHLLRDRQGPAWLEALSAKAGKQIYCAADFMGKKRLLLEAERTKLYEIMAVPTHWHEEYGKGLISAEDYLLRQQFPDGICSGLQ